MPRSTSIGLKERYTKSTDDVSQLTALLKDCTRKKDLLNGCKIHEDFLKRGFLETDACLGSTLINMYAKCGALGKSQELFDKFSVRDVVCWTTLVGGYAHHGRGMEALAVFHRMHHEGLLPDALTFVCVLKGCGSTGIIGTGKSVHVQIVEQTLLGNDVFVSNALVDMYTKCSALDEAQQVFDSLCVRDVITWTSLLFGYAQHGQGEMALDCFRKMQCEGLVPNAVTFVCILKACACTKEAKKGMQIHSALVKVEQVQFHFLVGNALVDMYAKSGFLEKARETFDSLPVRDLVSWNVLISGHAYRDHSDEVFYCWKQMQYEGFRPDSVTYVCILKACGSIQAVEKGNEIHNEIIREGLIAKHILVGNALVDMHIKCGDIRKAERVFYELPFHDVISWTTLIAGFSEYGFGEEALNHYKQMRHEGYHADAVTFVCVLKACGSIGTTEEGQSLHAEIIERGWLEKDVLVGNALVDMYAKCGTFTKALEVFSELLTQDVVSWNALISGYTQHGNGEEALNCFAEMQYKGFSPDAVTFLCTLKACTILGAVDKGQDIHAMIAKDGWLQKHALIGNALVDMYGKCGMIEKAKEVFSQLPRQAVVSWNSLLAGFAQLGEDELTFHTFEEMRRQCVEPDVITFTILLTSCSHSGLLGKGQLYFVMMNVYFRIIPTLEHYTCMIDMFGRAGQFRQLCIAIHEMPFFANHTLWLTVLSACRIWINLKLAESAFHHAIQLDKNDTAPYVLMRNIYIFAGMQEDADRIQTMGLKNDVGDGRFYSGDP